MLLLLFLMKGFIRKSQPINVFFSNVNVALQLIRILLVSTLGRKKEKPGDIVFYSNLTRVERRLVSWINSVERTPFGENLACHLLISFVSFVSLLYTMWEYTRKYSTSKFGISILANDKLNISFYPIKRVCGPNLYGEYSRMFIVVWYIRTKNILSFPSEWA